MKWNIGWGTVSECNMKCEFCYSSSTRKSIKQLGIIEWKNFIDDNHDLIQNINYGTGENSLYDEWFELVDYIGKNYPSIEQALTTNGYLYEKVKINSKYKDIVSKYISEIDVSLDFSNSDRHNKFRGNKKAFEWGINTLGFCKDNDIRATIVFLGTNEILDIDNLRGIFEIADKYGAKLRTNIYRPVGGINDHTVRFIASYDKILKAIKWISKEHKVLSLSDPLFSSILIGDTGNDDPSGTKSIRILSDGSITPSTYLISENFRFYNINNKNVLKKIDIKETGIDFNLPKICSNCKFKDSCKGGVYDRRYLWYSTFDTNDPYCPYREGNYLPDFKIKTVKDSSFQSIHDGYLPTMFFGV